ncbi:MAG TPA: GNAT family N-acetyltransferase [Vineibacter sp.]|nr:GNAT family N-acetyltransferase [Vineibacter sp.]
MARKSAPVVPRKLRDRRITRAAFADIALRALALGDLPQIARWLAYPHVASRWDPPHVALPAMVRDIDAADTSPFIIIARGRAVGYLQIYAATGSTFWAGHDLPHETFGLDLFVGEPDALRRGYGSASLALAAAHLFDIPGVARVQGDPGPDNKASLRAFEKAGFEHRGPITTPDGPAIYMAIDRRK